MNSEKGFCTVRRLPEEDEAIQQHERDNPKNAFAVSLQGRLWPNGSRLSYYFFDQERDAGLDQRTNEKKSWIGSEGQKNIVRQAFAIWQSVGVNLDIFEVNNRNEAKIRIGFMQGDGHWSHIGKKTPTNKNERTMNFDRDHGYPNQLSLDTALHEIGHALGFEHEHQNPKAGITWNESAVYDHFKKTQNWDDKKIKQNVLDKLEWRNIEGLTEWDKNSIMHYSFVAGLILNPSDLNKTGLTPAPGLSNPDKQLVREFYPLSEPVGNEALSIPSSLMVGQGFSLNLVAGEQVNLPLSFSSSGNYQINLAGDSEAVIAVLRKQNNAWIEIANSDDGVTWGHASLKITLETHHEYALRVRLYIRRKEGKAHVKLNKL